MKQYFNSANFILTKNCNLRCKYCYEKKENLVMSREIAEAGVRFLVNGAFKNKQHNITIGFFGGEPLLNLSLMDHIYDYARSYCDSFKISNNYEINPVFNLTTNGTFFDNEIEAFLTKWKKNSGNISIQFSYDGMPEQQNINRVFKDGSPSGDTIVETLNKYLDWANRTGVDTSKELSVHPVITKATLPYIFDTYKYYLDKNLYVWHLLLPEEDWNDEDAKIYGDQLSKLTDYIESTNPQLYLSTRLFNPNAQNSSDPCHESCQAGNTFCSISTDGKIYACHRAAENDKEDYIGELFDNNGKLFINKDKKAFYEEIKFQDLLGVKPCQECSSISHCNRCIAANIKSNILPSLCFPKCCKLTQIEDFYVDKAKTFLTKNNYIKNSNNEKCDCGTCSNEDLSKFLESLDTNFISLVRGISETNTVIADGLETLSSEMEAIRVRQNDILNLLIGFLLKQQGGETDYE